MRPMNQALREYRPKQPPGFEPEPERPFKTDFLHPAWCSTDPSCCKFERGADLDADRNPQLRVVLINPELTFGLTERDEKNIGSGRTDAANQCCLLVVVQVTKGWALGADDL